MKACVEADSHDETDKERHPELFNPFTNLAVAEEQMLLRVGLLPKPDLQLTVYSAEAS